VLRIKCTMHTNDPFKPERVRERGEGGKWQLKLDDWPEKAFHDLEDLPPRRAAGWKKYALIDDVDDYWWHNNITAQAVMLLLTGEFHIAFWQATKIPEDYLRDLGRCPSQRVFVMTLWEEEIQYVDFTLRELVQEFPSLLEPRQLQACRVQAGLGLGGMQGPVYQVKIPEIKQSYLFLLTTGPEPDNVQVFEGKRDTVQYLLRDADRIWAFCSRPQGREKIEVPFSIRAMWLKMKYKPSKSQDFLQSDFYKTALDAYSVWSFPLHQRQVQEALAILPKDIQVVVPGDGLGVVTASWTGTKQVISGDMVKTELTSSVVKQETFAQTMRRVGKKEDESVLILSYVYSLFTEEEKMMANSWQGSVIFIDSKDSCPMKGMVHIGPGTYAHLSSHRSPVMTVVEKQTAFAGIMYSENLLRYESIKFKMLSPTVQFWRGMRPFARHSQETSRLVVHDVQEWITLRRLGVDVNGAYIGVLGVEVDQVYSISITLDVQLEARTVYEISRKHPLVSALRYRTSYAEEGEKFFFFLPFQRK